MANARANVFRVCVCVCSLCRANALYFESERKGFSRSTSGEKKEEEAIRKREIHRMATAPRRDQTRLTKDN